MADEFDPEKYLTEKREALGDAPAPSDFDEAAAAQYLAEKTGAAPSVAEDRQAAAPTLSALETGGVHAANQLTGGLENKIIAAVQALYDKRHDKTGQVSFGDAYRRNLGQIDPIMDASDKAHPVARWVGNGIGFAGSLGALAAMAPARAVGAAAPTLAQLAGSGAKLGAVLGGIGGYGADRSDSALGTLANTGFGAFLGAGMGAASPYLAAGGSRLLGSAANALDSGAIATARRVLTGGANLSDSAKKALSDDAVRQALNEGAIRFGGTTKGAAQRLGDLVKDSSGSLDTATAALRNAGVVGPDAAMLATRYGQRADQLGAVYNTGGEKVYRDFADFLRQGAAPASTPWQPGTAIDGVSIPGNEAARMTDSELAAKLGIGQKPAASSEIPLDKAVEMKRSLQGDADYDKLVSKGVNKARKGLAGDFRQALLNAIQSQSDLHPEAATDYASQNERLSNLLAASKAATKGAAQASKRNAISLRDMGIAMSMLGGGAAAGHTGEGLGLAALGTLGSMGARKYGPSTLAALLYRGQAIPRTLAEAAGSRFATRALPLALGGRLGGTAGSFGLQPLTLGQLASGGQ